MKKIKFFRQNKTILTNCSRFSAYLGNKFSGICQLERYRHSRQITTFCAGNFENYIIFLVVKVPQKQKNSKDQKFPNSEPLKTCYLQTSAR